MIYHKPYKVKKTDCFGGGDGTSEPYSELIKQKMKKDTIIELKNVCKRYPMGNEVVHALNKVNVEIKRGDFVVMVGPSGSGKSTMMNMVGALAFSFFIGSLSGIFPAMQAAKLKPADALRYE